MEHCSKYRKLASAKWLSPCNENLKTQIRSLESTVEGMNQLPPQINIIQKISHRHDHRFVP